MCNQKKITMITKSYWEKIYFQKLMIRNKSDSWTKINSCVESWIYIYFWVKICTLNKMLYFQKYFEFIFIFLYKKRFCLNLYANLETIYVFLYNWTHLFTITICEKSHVHDVLHLKSFFKGIWINVNLQFWFILKESKYAIFCINSGRIYVFFTQNQKNLEKSWNFETRLVKTTKTILKIDIFLNIIPNFSISCVEVLIVFSKISYFWHQKFSIWHIFP